MGADGSRCQEGSSRKGFAPTLSVNRYVLVCILCAYCLVSGPTYFNWTPVADSLFQDGAFEWKCTPEELAVPKELSYAPRCHAQEMAVNDLFSVMSASHFFCSFFGGLALDMLGPKATGMLGTGIMLLGWVLMGLASQSFNVFTFAAILIGMSVDAAFFPCLSVANLFPRHGSTVIAIMGCFRSLSFVVPLAFRAAVVQSQVATVKQAMIFFAGVFLSLAFVVSLLLIPVKPFEKVEGDNQATIADQEAASSVSSKVVEAAIAPGGDGRRSARDAARAQLKAFAVDFCSAAYLPLIPLYAFLLTNVIFFVPSTLHLMPSAYSANQIIQTFSFLPCPVLGYVADKVGIMFVMQLTNLCGLLTYVCVLIPGIPAYAGLQYVASVLCSIQTSFLMSQLYCYASETFNPANLGRLVGLVCAVAGLVSLSTGPMRAFALKKGFLPMCILAISFACANVAILTFLHLLKIKKKRASGKTSPASELDAVAAV